MATHFHHIGTILLLLTFICAAIALGINDWSHNGYYQVGLWQSCDSGGNHCGSINCGSGGNSGLDCSGWFKAVRAFAIMAVVFSLLALIVGCFMFYSTYQRRHVTSVLSFWAGVCALVAWAIWVGKNSSDTFGAGVGLEIAAWLLAWIASFEIQAKANTVV